VEAVDSPLATPLRRGMTTDYPVPYILPLVRRHDAENKPLRRTPSDGGFLLASIDGAGKHKEICAYATRLSPMRSLRPDHSIGPSFRISSASRFTIVAV